ncbi:MAG: hypothetical protein O3B73_16860 [bacterium]|nr:hypothetical protein [bacterium]
MQTLKDVFKREAERNHLKNGAICIAIVIVVIFLAFGVGGLRFSFEQSPGAPSATHIPDGQGND